MAEESKSAKAAAFAEIVESEIVKALEEGNPITVEEAYKRAQESALFTPEDITPEQDGM